MSNESSRAGLHFEGITDAQFDANTAAARAVAARFNQTPEADAANRRAVDAAAKKLAARLNGTK